ncbi:MAG: sigma-E processing peptidase SpoIIGA [Oscillospiraceae bacterium]|nr:sigma-E processing peptidase SpoIIGA [Oscillospiraceae bacterium]
MQPVIYIDVLFLLNFFINSIILYATSKVAKRDVNLLFLSLGAAIGALYACVMFLDITAITATILGRLIFSILLVMLTFRAVNWRTVAKLTAIFYMTSFAFGGTVFGILFLTRASTTLGMVVSNGEVYLNIPIGILMFGICAAYTGVVVYTKIVRRKFENERLIVDVKINIKSEEIVTKALIDTGSELVEPVSKKPVIVVEYDVLMGLLPENVADLYNHTADFDCEILVDIIESNLGDYKFCLIPFAALGTKSGMMLGIIPDKIEFLGRKQPQTSCVIGICAEKLSSDDAFFALTHATLAY